jgi:hypothetical protein
MMNNTSSKNKYSYSGWQWLLQALLFGAILLCLILVVAFIVWYNFYVLINTSGHTALDLDFWSIIFLYIASTDATIIALTYIFRLRILRRRLQWLLLCASIFSYFNIVLYQHANVMNNYSLWLKKGMPIQAAPWHGQFWRSLLGQRKESANVGNKRSCNKLYADDGLRYSGDLVSSRTPDPRAEALARRIGGIADAYFSNDPDHHVFSVIGKSYIVELSSLDGLQKLCLKEDGVIFRAAKATRRAVYLYYDSPNHHESSLSKQTIDCADCYGVSVFIKTDLSDIP